MQVKKSMRGSAWILRPDILCSSHSTCCYAVIFIYNYEVVVTEHAPMNACL